MACSEACARAAAPVCVRIGRAFDAALIGPEQDATGAQDALADVPDEMVVEILKNYPPSTLLRVAGTNSRMREIVADPRTVRALVAHSFRRNAKYPRGRAINEWIALAKHAAGVGRTSLVEAIVGAIDAQPTYDFMDTIPDDTRRGWKLTRVIMALRTGDVDFVRRVGGDIDSADFVGLAEYVVRMQDVAAMRAYLACMRTPTNIILFTFQHQLERSELFYDKAVFAKLLASPHWNIVAEHQQQPIPPHLTRALPPSTDAVLVDAILLQDPEIVTMLLASGRIPLRPRLFNVPTSDQITAFLLANRTLNPFACATLAEYNRCRDQTAIVEPSRIRVNHHFLWG